MTRHFRPRLAAAAVLTALTTFGAAAHTARAEPSGPDVPGTIAVPAGHQVFLVAHAVGAQKYTCSGGPGGPRWSFAGPSAELYADNGNFLGTHYGGPTWETRDGSTVRASRVDGVVMDQTAIPWLLLARTTTSTGPDGDRLSATSYIQRTATTGGLEPPASQCNESTAGTTTEVPYTADYWFWKATGG